LPAHCRRLAASPRRGRPWNGPSANSSPPVPLTLQRTQHTLRSEILRPCSEKPSRLLARFPLALSPQHSCLVPFSLRRSALSQRRLSRLPSVLQLLTHHTNLKQDPFCRNPLANRFQLRRRNLLRTMRDIQQHAFELIEYGSQRRVALLHRCLPVQAILFQQILRAPLLGRDVHLLGTR